MASTLDRLRSEQHGAIGDVIEQSSGEIISRWAARVKEEQSSAQRVHHDVLVDHLPAFLEKLGRSLATASDDSEDARQEAIEHGDQRWDNGWSITEVVRDYQILRIVMVDFLESSLGRRLGVRESLVLNVVIDDAIAAAVAAFAASQTTPGTAASTTRNEALELLLNVLGVIGHELRNPLAPLTNSLEVLRMVGADPVQFETTRQIMGRQLQVLGRLVEDLMDLPRLARGKMSLVRERLDLTRLMQTIAEDWRKVLEAAGLTIQVELPSESVWIFGDRTRLTQAFGNLINNSKKFSERGGLVSVRMSGTQDSGQAIVTIRDTGIGIDPAFLPKVFEAYTQADQTLNRSRGGLGLGLALVKGVVELHRGSVAAFSDGPGKGAAFTVTLPRCDGAATGAPGNSADAPPSVKPKRVLIIEDNADSAASLKIYLELHGHSVTIANSGSDGLRVAAAIKPDVVVCDVGLPDADGYAVAAELRSLSPPPALIIAVSGHGARQAPDGEPDRAFDYYLLKPADPARVARLLSVESHAGE